MKKSERASQIWAVLAWAAKNRQTLTYSHLSKLIGVSPVGLGPFLDPIYVYCCQENLPPLTVIVVQKGSGLPGPGFSMNGADHARACMDVYEYDWLEHGNPGPDAFKHPSNE
jgi:hypothetical protein